MFLSIDPVFLLIGIVLAASLLGFIITPMLTSRSRFNQPRLTGVTPDGGGPVAMLFRDDLLVDATEPALSLIRDATTLRDVARTMAPRFPGIISVQAVNEPTLQVSSEIPGDGGYLELTRNGDALSVVLRDNHPRPAEHHALLSSEKELHRLRSVVEKAPAAIWTTNAEGQVLDSNVEYNQLCERSASRDPFRMDVNASLMARDTRRTSLETDKDGTCLWFDVTSRAISEEATGHFAISADALVSAEVAQRNFVQTLTKTFAQLSIGLAIFDRNRQLALFNPALIDLTQLPADVLSARPSLSSFFDQLRDRQIMPEPRNYKNWREQLSDMLAAAQDGQYCETWTLPSGLTYRISGKPHPDGAVAFLFEDISAEISLTRRFRAELELSQSALDAMDCAIAVFSRSGTLTFANNRFSEMWKCSPDESFIEMTILDMSRIWLDGSDPSPVWGEISSFVSAIEDRAEWHDRVVHKEEGTLDVEVNPLSGGATLVRFSRAKKAASYGANPLLAPGVVQPQ